MSVCRREMGFTVVKPTVDLCLGPCDGPRGRGRSIMSEVPP